MSFDQQAAQPLLRRLLKEGHREAVAMSAAEPPQGARPLLEEGESTAQRAATGEVSQ